MKLTGRNSLYKFSGVLLTLIVTVFLLGLLGMVSARSQSCSTKLYKTEQQFEVINCRTSFLVKCLLINWMACNELFALVIAFFIWICQFSLQSNATPRTFMLSLLKRSFPFRFRVTGGRSFLQNKHISVLLSFTFNPESFNQFVINSS